MQSVSNSFLFIIFVEKGFMRSIFGRINITNTPVNQDLFKKSIDELSVFKACSRETSVHETECFGQVYFGPSTKKTLSGENSNLILLSDAAIYNTQELNNLLNLAEKTLDPDVIIYKAYEKWGKDCVNYLIGDFAFAIWNKETQELFCVRDHLGVKPLNYYYDESCFVFSSDVSAIVCQSDLNLSVDQRQIADTLSIVKSEKNRTTYSEIKKLPPGHSLSWKKGKLTLEKYWDLKPQQTIQKKDVEIIAEFKSMLEESVLCRTKSHKYIGSELSGGVDSSSIAALASKFVPLKTFSHILPDHLIGKIHPFKDEREFIHLLGDFCNISERHFITSEVSLLNTLKQHVKDFKNLSQQNFGIFSDQLYKKAEEQNIEVLLSGFGGDEVVTSKSASYLTELAKNKQWEEIKIDLKNQYPSQTVFFKKYFKLRLKDLFPALKRLRFKTAWWKPKYNNLALNKDFEKNAKIKKRYFEYYQNMQTHSLQERNIERITHPHVSQRLEYCSLIARKYGVEYRYPLLDIRLIEYYLAIPPRLKARNGIGRYIMRKAIEGIVPPKIQWRTDKSGATIPTVFMRMMRDENEIADLIERARTNPLVRKYIDLDKYEQWYDKLRRRSEGNQKYINPGAFYNYLKLILFIENNPGLFQ